MVETVAFLTSKVLPNWEKKRKKEKKNNSMIYGLPHSLQPTPKSWDRGLIFLEYCLPFPPRRDL